MASNKERKGNTAEVSFFKFLWSKERGIELLAFLSLSIILMFWYLSAYPYPIINGDSGNYILRAREMTIGAYRPFGYSVFIAWLHDLSKDIRVIFYGQYFLNFLATTFFLFSIKYLLNLNKLWYYIVSFVMLVSPSVLYLTVLVMSDSLFYVLCLLFLVSILWLIKTDNKWWVVLIHLLLLYFLLYTRYVALIYPFVSLIALLWGKFTYLRLMVSLSPLLVAVLFYNKVKHKMEEVFNIEIFSGFSGWALANNAVSVVPYTDLKLDDIKDLEVKYVHSFVIKQPDSVYASFKYIRSTNFMWRKDMPAKLMMMDYRKQRQTTYPKLWLYSGQMLQKYALYMIKNHPWLYFRYFIIPNIGEIFSTFEIREWDTFDPLKLDYFEYPVQEYTYTKPLISKMQYLRMTTTFLGWFLFPIAVVFLILKRKSIQPSVFAMLCCIWLFLLAHCFMSVIGHPINNFRYLLPIYPILLITICFGLMQFGQRKREGKNAIGK